MAGEPAAGAAAREGGLRVMGPGAFAIVMGLAGLALAWHRSVPSMGAAAHGVAVGIAVLALAAFVALALAFLVRHVRHPSALAEDLAHPVAHAFIATLPVSVILLATLGVALDGPSTWLALPWMLGALAQMWATLWSLGRWWRGNGPGGLQWASATPALLIPIVGNVLVPLAGVPLGYATWSAAQFGIGLAFWPVVMMLVVVRIAVQGLWPDRLLPAGFIVVAPPAVIALSLLQFGAPVLVAWALWGLAAFLLAWAALLVPRILRLPLALPHWGLSFPLAAFAALTLRLAPGDGPAAGVAAAPLALATLVIAGLSVATVRGLARGTLLVPEPAPAPAGAGATATAQPTAA